VSSAMLVMGGFVFMIMFWLSPSGVQ